MRKVPKAVQSKYNGQDVEMPSLQRKGPAAEEAGCWGFRFQRGWCDIRGVVQVANAT